VQCRRGPATVTGESIEITTASAEKSQVGRFEGAMIQSQETYLFSTNTRVTYEE
jgi:hypothetical protein